MENTEDEDKTLNRNSIKSFILRIDLLQNATLNLTAIAESLTSRFDRAEKKQVSNLTVNFTQNESLFGRKETYDFVLVSEKNSLSMTFSEVQNAFWIESSQYKNNSVYKEIISEVIDVVTDAAEDANARRIGLRYINEFKCDKLNSVGSIFGKRIATIIKNMMGETNQTRVIGVEEYNNEGNKLRLQYGIPNRFYPSQITVFDLLLDIDSYTESTIAFNEVEEVISELNHAAYAAFINEMNDKFLEKLK